VFNWPQFEHHDGWFFVFIGTLFVMFARPYGRALGGKVEYDLDGSTMSPEQVSADAGRHTLVAYICGAASIAWGLWLLLSH
jgi:hypothetical protein